MFLYSFLTCFVPKIVYAQSLSDNINEQLNNIDFSELEQWVNSIEELGANFDYMGVIKNFLNGDISFDFNNIANSFFNIFISNIKKYAPSMVSILAISLFIIFILNFQGNFFNKQIGDVIIYCSYLFVVIILFTQIISFYNSSKIIIENLIKLMQIMSPIILSLMVASGGNMSATIYQPAVTFLTTGISTIILNFVFPIIYLIGVFSIFNTITGSINLGKLAGFFSDVLKWVFGIIVTVFTIFLSIQGITASVYDGISFKAAKYAISNSIPIVGGFIRDGFDLVVAGSVIIKNSIGLMGVFAVLFTIATPLIMLCSFNVLLKFIGFLLNSLSDNFISSICLNSSKCITYMCVSILVVGLMFFITILLMIISANFVI